MPKSRNLGVLPMKTSGIQHLIERTYREGGAHQWARETLVNAQQAAANQIHFGVEWQAVASKGVYRRMIADDGSGMTAEQLTTFFNTFGGGGKPIGGIHENFGVGAKTSLLPWNRHGLVVVSWVGGDASMIWVRQDPESGEYGLRLYRAVNSAGDESLESVVEPYLDTEHGVDWRKVKPSWIGDHGTVMVLMGNGPKDDTILGDPARDEGDLKGLAAYLNRRFLQVPETLSITVDELRTSDRAQWPRSEDEGHGGQPDVGSDRRTNLRTIKGALHYIEYPRAKGGQIAAKGQLTLRDGTTADWYLWEGERPAVQSYAAYSGYVAAIYANELYDVASHHAIYRSFGVSDQGVRSRLWILLTPPPYNDKTRRGVYPRTDRNALLLAGGPQAGSPLPMHTWSAEFAERMPEEIREALRQARPTEEGTIDDSWRERIQERFGARWRIAKLRVQRGGQFPVDPTAPGGTVGPSVHSKPRREEPEEAADHKEVPVGLQGADRIGVTPGPRRAARALVGGGIPTYRTVHKEALGPGMVAGWQPHDPEHPEGVVLLNMDHPMLLEQVVHWQAQYPDYMAHEVEREVLDVYGMVLVARLAHSEKFKSLLPAQVVEEDMRSEASLTMSVLGLLAEEAVIAARLSGKLGRKKAATAEGPAVEAA